MTRPAPYPADTKAKGWRFELDHERIDQSDTWALATPALRPWLLMVWLVSWKQIPCGSLPADDELIAARLGMDLDLFMQSKKILLRGWWLADDGRLYHDTVVEMVQSMLATKTKERDRKAAYRAQKDKERGDLSRGTNTGHPAEVQGSPIGGDDTGTGTGTSTYIPEPGFSARANADGDFFGDQEAGSPPAQLTAPPGAPKPGQVTFAMKAAGIADVSPSNQKLLTLIAAGATVDEFVDAAKKAVTGGKGFAYALGIVERERRDAAALVGQLHTGPLPRAGATRSAGATPESFRERDLRMAAEEVAKWAPRIADTGGQPIEHPATIIDLEPPHALVHQSN